jgi:Fic family protein
MALYNWQRATWPNFVHDPVALEEDLFSFAEKAGRITGAWQALPEITQQETVIGTMVAEAIKTSEIEGEFLNREDVFSSIKKNLGLHDGNRHVKDRRAVGIAELMLDVRNSWQVPLTEETLFSWHRMLLGDSRRILVGAWRTHEEPMQIVSGAIGREKVHYEAPPSSRVPQEMEQFIAWFNQTDRESGSVLRQAPIRCAIAHLYFESIHPFEDGNGRIGRAIAEKALSQGLGRPVLLSLSEAIQVRKRAYYDALKEAQRTNEITGWIRYFLQTILDAQTRAESMIDFTIRKAKFFDRFRERLSERQQKAILRMLESGPGHVEQGVSAGKYADITQTSKATATRDLQELIEFGAIVRLGEAGGRSTRYRVEL